MWKITVYRRNRTVCLNVFSTLFLNASMKKLLKKSILGSKRNCVTSHIHTELSIFRTIFPFYNPLWTDDVGAVSWWAHRVTCKNYAWKTTAREKSDWHGRFTPNAKLLLLPINANRKGHLVYYQYYYQSTAMFWKWKISAINNMYIICTIISQRLNPILIQKFTPGPLICHPKENFNHCWFYSLKH